MLVKSVEPLTRLTMWTVQRCPQGFALTMSTLFYTVRIAHYVRDLELPIAVSDDTVTLYCKIYKEYALNSLSLENQGFWAQTVMSYLHDSQQGVTLGNHLYCVNQRFLPELGGLYQTTSRFVCKNERREDVAVFLKGLRVAAVGDIGMYLDNFFEEDTPLRFVEVEQEQRTRFLTPPPSVACDSEDDECRSDDFSTLLEIPEVWDVWCTEESTYLSL